MRITAIEPYPRPFLRSLEGLHALRVERVQDTPASVFAELSSGDVLFIDSSHVLKTGSDLVHLFTTVLPTLQQGVRIHVHDVFLPDDYPPQWVLDENRSWNEQYALQSMLRSEEHTSELQSLMRISYAVFCLKKTNNTHKKLNYTHST